MQRSKIERLPGVKEYVLQRVKETDNKISYSQLANEINAKFNLIGRDKVSFMAVKRFLDKYHQKEIQEIVEKDGTLAPLVTEFRKKMNKIIDDTDYLIEKAKESENIRDIILALEQQRKNLVSLIKYGECIIDKAEKISIQYDQNVKVYILKLAETLPIEYRRKLIEALDSNDLIV